MPMRSAAVATFDKAIRPRAGGRFGLFVWRVARRIGTLVAVAWRWRIGALILAKLLGDEGTPLRLSSSILRRISRASKSPRTSRVVTCVSTRLPVAPFITSFTSKIALIKSLKPRTTAHSFSAMSESPS
eukprot:6204927-Pleurochrysis_carterae.AAC.3